MKIIKWLSFIGLFMAVGLNLYSQDSLSAKVYFIRRTGFNSFAQTYDVFIDRRRVCTLDNDRFSIYNLGEGQHEFDVKETNDHLTVTYAPTVMNVEKGKIYYLELNFGEGALSQIQFASISEKKAKKQIKNCQKDPQCQN
jgi:hypothetical protein